MREHGTRAKYVAEKCRCPECREASRVYERARIRRKLYGRDPWVNASRARRHVRRLMASGVGQNDGVGWRRIAEVAGVSPSAVSKLIYGGPGKRKPSRRIHQDTERKLLSVTRENAAEGSTTDAAETWVLVEEIVAYFNSLNYRGYGGKAKLGRYLTGNPNADSLQLSRHKVSVKHARMVRVLHDQLETSSEDFRWRFCSCHGAAHGVAS